VIDHIRLFQVIVEKGSLVAAGRELGLSATTVSERLAALEAHYGVTLLNRTTRSLSLTDAGQTLLTGSKAVLAEMEDLEARIKHGANSLSGPIRISAPVDLGRSLVSSVIDRFTQEHPAISIELALSDGYVNMVRDGFDLALRFGSIGDSTLRIKNLGHFKRVVCAAPEYLQQNATPQTPADLSRHNCLVMRFGNTLDNVWHFAFGQQKQAVIVSGDKIVNDGYLVRQWALAGHGIILKSEFDVGQDLKKGKLVALLQEYASPPTALQIMFPPGRAQPRRIRALAEKLQTAVGNQNSGQAITYL
jgi:DNA-binding transcriptional LysR family regulator